MAKSRMNLELDVERYGPLFDGRASEAVKQWLDDTKQEVADIGADWIRLAALGMDKSGRGGTGRAAAAVEVSKYGTFNDVRVFGGMVTGQVWWPWLEGDSQRNVGSKFKGYHVFRLTRLRLRRIVTPLAQQRLEEFIGRMGGHTG
jgi:hypothetical protein